MLQENQIESIENIIHYSFKNKALLIQALTRKSFSKENPEYENNEVLEFYGDKILSFIIAYKLSSAFGSLEDTQTQLAQYKSAEQEGSLTNRFSENTRNETLSNSIKKAGLLDFVLKSTNDPLGFKSSGDILEALLGAVALDSDWNLSSLCAVVDALLNPAESFQKKAVNTNDFVFRLNELCENHKIELSELIINRNSADYVSKLQLTYNQQQKNFKQKAKSEKGASLSICRRAYIFAKLFWLHEPVEEWIINPVSQLQELLAGKLIDSLEFGVQQSESHKHSKNQTLWQYKCQVTVNSKTFNSVSRQFPRQKTGKAEAARIILPEVLFQLKRNSLKGQGLFKIISQMGY